MTKILGAFEQKLAEMASDEERKAYQEEQKCNSNLDKIIVQVKFCGCFLLSVEYLFFRVQVGYKIKL